MANVGIYVVNIQYIGNLYLVAENIFFSHNTHTHTHTHTCTHTLTHTMGIIIASGRRNCFGSFPGIFDDSLPVPGVLVYMGIWERCMGICEYVGHYMGICPQFPQ